MNYKIVRNILIVIALVFFGWLFFYKTNLFDNFKSNQTVSDLNNFLDEKVRVLSKSHLDNPGLQDIYIKQDSGQEIFYGTYADVYIEHYHWAEYHHGHVYLIRRAVALAGNDWQDELWRLDPKGPGKKIYGAPGLDFRVSPDEKFIAITADNQLIIHNQSDQKNTTLSISELTLDDQARISIDGWSDNSQSLWGSANLGSQTVNFFRFNGVAKMVDKFVSPQDYHGRGFALNFNTGVMAYSDYPLFFDVDSDNQFIASQAMVKLKIRNLLTRKEIIITEAKAKYFRTQWLNDSTVEYNNPNGDGQLQFNVPTDFYKL